jgi:hypothetical protein
VSHPSFLELDRLALGDGTSASRSHVEACDVCSAHLARVREAAMVPEWARDAAEARRLRWPRFRWLGSLAVACAAAASAIVFVVPEQPTAYLAPKGMPSVAVYVSRDGRTMLWNGSEALRPGDRIRLKIAPEGYGWVAVSARAASGAFSVLHRAQIDPAGEYLLPESFRLDDAAGPEQIHIALDARPVDPASAAWSTTLEIPKEPAE